MPGFFSTVGMGVVAVLVGVVLGSLAILAWARRKLGRQGLALARMGRQPVAARITLERAAQGFRQAGTAALVEAVQAEGYREAGVFDVREMAGMRIWGGCHPLDGSVAIVYDHAVLAPWFDLVRVYAHASDTVSTAISHDPRHTPPGSTMLVERTLDPAAARAALAAIPASGTPIKVEAGHFVGMFTEAYARTMDHILSLGPPDMADLDRVSESFDGPRGLSVEQKRLALDAVRRDRLDALEVALLDRFLESGQVTAREWHALQDRAVVVHERMDDAEALELALQFSDLGHDEPRVAAITSARAGMPVELFEEVNALLPEPSAWNRRGAVEAPVRGVVYVTPA
jgi:hypothetical protein